MKYSPEQLRNSAGYTEALLVKRGLELVTVEAVGHMEQLRAHADALDERQELIEALTGAVALIDGDLVGADWKAACREFTKDARAILARLDK